MRGPHCKANLDQLCSNLQEYARTNSIAARTSPTAARLSDSLFLANSASRTNFRDICASGNIDSRAHLASARSQTLPAECTEFILGTANSVFFYVAPFRYPGTDCGLLFSATLEIAHTVNGVATPFDSGGLLNIFKTPDPRAFLSRHDMPIPEHRRYLTLCMDLLFRQPEDYVDGTDPSYPGPVGLTGGDYRRWTHEVRIPDRVLLRSRHLQAAFAPTPLVADSIVVKSLFKWCDEQGVDSISFDAPRGGEFAALQRKCRDYIREKLQ